MTSTVEQRYRDDPQFHALVDTMYASICALNYTPSEMRDAVMLAALKYDLTHLRTMQFPAGTRGVSL